jgi:Arc/MetJ-type ribon-helix-helix transcriptional regulator
MGKRVEMELPEKLYEKIVRQIEGGEYATVSEFIRAAIRKMLEQ